jgi:Immunity protein 8
LTEQGTQLGGWAVSEVRYFDSPDLDPLETSQPPDPTDFSILVEVTVGPKGQRGGELFGISVCTPTHLRRLVSPGSYLFARHYLIVDRYDYRQIHAAIHKLFNGVQRTTWIEVAEVLARWGHWEFEDLQEGPVV